MNKRMVSADSVVAVDERWTIEASAISARNPLQEQHDNRVHEKGACILQCNRSTNK